MGTWRIPRSDAKSAVSAAIDIGYRLIDCAPVYQNEDLIGEAVAEAIKAGKVKREDLFVTSKLWNTCHKKEHVMGALDQTLKDLKLDYLDLYLMHFPVAFEFTGYDLKKAEVFPKDQNGNLRFPKGVSLEETWHAMEALLDTGKVRAIGICNYTMIPLLDMLAYCKVTPAVLQMEIHPYYNRAELIQFARSKGIHIEAYGSLGSGKADLMSDPKVKEIAKKLHTTEAKVLLRWALEHRYTIIPKSSNAKRLKENFELYDFRLDQEDMKALDNMNKNFIAVDTREYWGFPIYV